MLKIGVDAMGGDFAPEAAVKVVLLVQFTALWQQVP